MTEKDVKIKEESSEEDDDGPIDIDSVGSDEELASYFASKFSICNEEPISNSYITHMAASAEFNNIIVGTSAHTVHLFNVTSNCLANVILPGTLSQTSSAITGVRFANQSEHILYLSLANGDIFQHDLRAPGVVEKFQLAPSEGPRPVTCFDLNANDRILCTGTEQVAQDTYINFYDTRQRRHMGFYWESHTGDITALSFHPTNSDRLASGAGDGLINIYDIDNASESDALQYCMNTESSIANLRWHSDDHNGVAKDLLTCLTQSHDLHVYDVDESELLMPAFDRIKLTSLLKQKSVMSCYVIDCHPMAKIGQTLLLAGSYAAGENKVLRSLVVPLHKKGTKESAPSGATNFRENQQIVRCSVYNKKENVLITAGENGCITIWQGDNVNADDEDDVKAPVHLPKSSDDLVERVKDKKKKQHKAKPY